MDLRQLAILQAIAETGSFTAGGRKLHVSQSAISRQIGHGVFLFNWRKASRCFCVSVVRFA